MFKWDKQMIKQCVLGHSTYLHKKVCFTLDTYWITNRTTLWIAENKSAFYIKGEVSFP
jgi:hypothetical protein